MSKCLLELLSIKGILLQRGLRGSGLNPELYTYVLSLRGLHGGLGLRVSEVFLAKPELSTLCVRNVSMRLQP